MRLPSRMSRWYVCDVLVLILKTTSMTIKVSAMILAIASLVFVSCKKDKSGPDNPGNNPGNPTKRISRIEENGITSATFEYNPDGTLKRISSVTSPDHTTHFTFTYNAEKKVTEFVTDEGYKAKYVYINGKLDRTENYSDGEKVSESVFTYENNRIKTNTLFSGFPQGGGTVFYKPTYRAVYSYFGNGNVMRIEIQALNRQSGEMEVKQIHMYHQYDNKKNPLAVLSDFSQIVLYQPAHINNPLAEELLDANGGFLESTNNVYTYDDAGYPVTLKTTIKDESGVPNVINVKFFY